ncbi:YggS family pyridoxal phosphate-dependent enzyme [bacterium]|nr:YggS family pyridoxal phosphate-dependent enzyme [bacterium]
MSHKSGDADNHKTEQSVIPTSCWGSGVSADAKLIEKNLLGIKEEFAHCKLRIIGVTKYFGLNAIVEGYNAGLRDFGESRALEAVEKINQLPLDVREGSRFHFIGHLQTNKADLVVRHFDYIHSVDSLKLAKVISKAACSLNKREKVLLQVNNSGETQKFGYSKNSLMADLPEIKLLEGIELVGLMNMAPLDADELELRKLFCDLREFRDELEKKFELKLPELSMGMSNDYRIAVQEGATMIRIGRKLFK